MISIKEINAEITSIQREEEKKAPTERSRRQLKRIALLNTLKYYLDTKPSEAFVRKQLQNVQQEIADIKTGYSQWYNDHILEAQSMKNPKSYYEKESGMPKLRLQLRALQTLLK